MDALSIQIADMFGVSAMCVVKIKKLTMWENIPGPEPIPLAKARGGRRKVEVYEDITIAGR